MMVCFTSVPFELKKEGSRDRDKPSIKKRFDYSASDQRSERKIRAMACCSCGLDRLLLVPIETGAG